MSAFWILSTLYADCSGLSKACEGSQCPWKIVSKRHDRQTTGCVHLRLEPLKMYLFVELETVPPLSGILNIGIINICLFDIL